MNELRLRLTGIRSEYLRFMIENVPGRRFPELRIVVLTRAGIDLGYIGYYTSWRQFVFFPRGSTVWSKGCLADIETALGIVAEAWKEKKRRP